MSAFVGRESDQPQLVGGDGRGAGGVSDGASGGEEAGSGGGASSSGAEFGPDDERIIGLLALGFSHERAGDEVGVSAKTIQRRLRNPEFRARVNERKRDLHAESWERLLGLRERATEVFAASLDSDQERFRMQAARTVYELAARIRREQVVEELNARVEELELELARRTQGEDQ